MIVRTVESSRECVRLVQKKEAVLLLREKP